MAKPEETEAKVKEHEAKIAGLGARIAALEALNAGARLSTMEGKASWWTDACSFLMKHTAHVWGSK